LTIGPFAKSGLTAEHVEATLGPKITAGFFGNSSLTIWTATTGLL